MCLRSYLRLQGLWQSVTADFLDHNGRQIVLLGGTVCELENACVELSNDFLGAEMTVGPDDLFQPLGPELLSRCVLPLEKSIGDQQDEISRLHRNDLGFRSGQLRQDSQRDIVSRISLELAILV